MTQDLTRRSFLGAAGVAAGSLAGVAAANEAPKAAAGKIKIVGIGCSPREPSSTAASVQVCLEAAQEVDPDGIDVELIKLAGMRIHGSVAAGVHAGCGPAPPASRRSATG